jgi:methylase of polypeptide subunit release factors
MRYSRQKQRPGQFQSSFWPATSLSRPGCGDFRKRDHGRRSLRSGRYLADETPAISYCVSETNSEIARLARHDMRTTYEDTSALDRATLPPSRSKQLLRTAIHLLSYHFILTRRRTTVARVAGFRLSVRPTVFHPRYFLSSKFFANFLSDIDLAGKRVADVGTGSGILALAAARGEQRA